MTTEDKIRHADVGVELMEMFLPIFPDTAEARTIKATVECVVDRSKYFLNQWRHHPWGNEENIDTMIEINTYNLNQLRYYFDGLCGEGNWGDS